MIEADYVQDVLRTIDDPEMPISIVDLGIVEGVRIETAGRAPGEFAVQVDLLPTFVGCPALDVLRELVTSKLRAAGAAAVTVNFVYQPPWGTERISDAGRARLQRFGISVPQSGSCGGSAPAFGGPATLVPLGISRRSEGAQGADAAQGVTPDVNPAELYRDEGAGEAVPCPLCGSTATALQSPFGPTRCKMIYHCEACRNPFERLKHV